ncbi:MAG: hypothetical protein FD161_514 [Limisphaerales bacterium]|nr:MAG: hypothetical protein FD161_514 [Limisphaerales bacterium]KAG0510419.1 MAG: hypothetical protein E1N63_514 [Limisphaerales bacterium]TXT51606.1 MAG: hypothetical protein FD140_1644 [Limisphaerales bacterium]
MKLLLRPALLCLSALWLTATVHAAGPETFKVSEFTFKRPGSWEWVEVQSQMRKAQLKVTAKDAKEPGEVVFFFFGPQSGGTKANVDRWFGQFEEGRDKINAKTEEKKFAKAVVTYVSAEGTYKSGMPGQPPTPKAGFALLGGIVEGSEGSVFVRLTGPAALVKGARADFEKMIESGLK